jgi:pyridoxine kinase
VATVKRANPDARYTCDPVMGNAASGCFVRGGIPELFRDRLVPAADIVTPNQFEIGFLTDSEPRTLDEVVATADLLRERGPAVVLVTSVEHPEQEPDTIEMMAVTDDGAWLVATPRLPLHANGSGDLTSALFTAHLHETGSPVDALSRVAASVYGVLLATWESGERELQLVAAQGAIAEPASTFAVRRLR